MLETSCLDEAQKNRRAGQGIGAHLRRALLWFKWREWMPAAPWYTGLQLSISANTFILTLNYGAVTASCLGMHKLVMWSKCRLGANPALHGGSFLDFGVRGVFVLDEHKIDFLPVSLSQSWTAPKHVWCIQAAGGRAFLNFTFPILGECLTGMRFWSEHNYFGGSRR